jgi:hypothetical protein
MVAPVAGGLDGKSSIGPAEVAGGDASRHAALAAFSADAGGLIVT